MTQSSGAVDYAYCTSAEGQDSRHPNEYSEYETKPLDGKASILDLLRM